MLREMNNSRNDVRSSVGVVGVAGVVGVGGHVCKAKGDLGGYFVKVKCAGRLCSICEWSARSYTTHDPHVPIKQ